MDRSQVQFGLLKITLGVLACTSWLSASFIFSTKPRSAPETTFTSIVRLPASIPSGLPENIFAPSSRAMDPVRMDIVDVACWDGVAQDERSVNSRWIRLTGRACMKSNQPERVSVKNLSNGYEATVFVSGGEALTTDFIPLQSGANDILLRFEQGQGAATENRIVFRRE